MDSHFQLRTIALSPAARALARFVREARDVGAVAERASCRRKFVRGTTLRSGVGGAVGLLEVETPRYHVTVRAGYSLGSTIRGRRGRGLFRFIRGQLFLEAVNLRFAFGEGVHQPL
jgi:hypothetical protein